MIDTDQRTGADLGVNIYYRGILLDPALILNSFVKPGGGGNSNIPAFGDLTTDVIYEGARLYFTAARAVAAVQAVMDDGPDIVWNLVAPPAGSIAAALTNTTVTPGTYGDDTHVARFTVDAKGRVTFAEEVAITGGGGGSGNYALDTTTLASGASSPVAMFTKPANAVIELVEWIIDTPFDGTPTASVGIAGAVEKYMPAEAIDLTFAAQTAFEYSPNVAAIGTTESLIITFSAGGATAGSARCLIHYGIPS